MKKQVMKLVADMGYVCHYSGHTNTFFVKPFYNKQHEVVAMQKCTLPGLIDRLMFLTDRFTFKSQTI